MQTPTTLGSRSRRRSGLLDDPHLIQRILDHIDRGTTDLAEATWSEPVDNYRSEDRLRWEIEGVLRRHPTPFCPSAALPTAGSYVARIALGVPIMAVRGHDGVVRAFRNACRHRGTALVSGSGCSKSLVCPYHGWVYRLDGELRRVPHENGFPGMDKADHGLVGLRSEERSGLVFVTQDDLSVEQPSLRSLPPLVGKDQDLLGATEIMVEANWKVLLEGFLEGYHLRATHPDTFLPFGYDNLTVVETFGPNSRVTFPFRRIEALRAVPPEERRADGRVTFVYHLFPNVIVAQLAHHTNVVVLEPVAVDRTNLVSYLLTNGGRRASARGDTRRDSDFVGRGAIEDREMACRVQLGLSGGADGTVVFGLFEGAITHFHRQLAARLSRGRTVSPDVGSTRFEKEVEMT